MYFHQAAGLADIIDQLQRLMLEGEALYIAGAEAEGAAHSKEPEAQTPPVPKTNP